MYGMGRSYFAQYVDEKEKNIPGVQVKDMLVI